MECLGVRRIPCRHRGAFQKQTNNNTHTSMKLITILALSLATAAFGEDVTIVGEAKCGKCALGKSEKCHTVVVTKDKDGNELVYWVVDNDKDKELHEAVCKTTKDVTVVGDAGQKTDGTKTIKITSYEFKK